MVAMWGGGGGGGGGGHQCREVAPRGHQAVYGGALKLPRSLRLSYHY